MTDLYAFPKPGDSSKSILIMDVHPSVGVNPPGPTTAEPFAPEALYQIKIDTDRDAVTDITYQVRFASSKGGAQTATLRRMEGAQAAGTGEGGQVIVEGAPVSTGREAQVTEAGDYRFFAGWRSDPFFFDVQGAQNNFQFTVEDFLVDKDVFSIVLELPSSALGLEEVGLWARALSGRRATAEVGLRRSVARGPYNSLSLSANRTRSIGPGSRRTMPVSSLCSLTRWSIRAGIRRRKQGGWQEHSCRTSCATTPRARRPTRAMAANLPTTSPMPS